MEALKGKTIQDLAMDIFKEHNEFLISALTKSLRKQVNTQDIIRSLEAVISRNGDDITSTLQFEDYQRLTDLREKVRNPPAPVYQRWRKQKPPPPLYVVEDWLMKKGFVSDYVPGYSANSRKAKSLTEDQKLQRISRAITNSYKTEKTRYIRAGRLRRINNVLKAQIRREIAKLAMFELVNELSNG